jgi:hypothetical protein
LADWLINFCAYLPRDRASSRPALSFDELQRKVWSYDTLRLSDAED